MNILDYILIAILAVCVCIALRFVFRRKKKGGCCGRGRCDGCSIKN
ncbi:MAG TPA: FeoB-associated Cys-rich membrane protein [Bacillota bacterium]|nr:FeoB-associated Cys-rich membrane protein [Bacillota bacterium]HOK68767.1 FeoB-associated Cys-rich membrane protein [Bacillota bacterium]HPP85762.1 FeoB-associated Cys-rich membrane protein [Bacillota bacterium]